MHSRAGGDEKLLLKTKIFPSRERSCNDVDLARGWLGRFIMWL